MNGRVHVARLLLEFGATPGAFALIEFNEWRPLHLAAREGVASDKVLADPPDYNPATTYALNGDFYRIGRGGTFRTPSK